MAKTARARPIGEKGAARLAQIRIEAARLFVERGYDRTSVQDIADAVGLTKAGLYHFVESKEELLSLIIDAGVGRLEREVIDPVRGIEDPAERIAALIRAHIDNLSRIDSSTGNPVTTVVENLIGLSDEKRAVVERRLRQVFDIMRDSLRELEAAGRLNPGLDPTAVAFSIVGMVMWTNRWRRPGGRLAPDQVADNIVRLALHGILKD